MKSTASNDAKASSYKSQKSISSVCSSVNAAVVPIASNSNVPNKAHAELDKKLAAVRASAQEGYGFHLTARDHLYRIFGEIYVLAREFQKDHAYLAKHYSDAGIKGSVFKDDAKFNFRSFLRFVFGWSKLSGYQANKVLAWARALAAIDDHFSVHHAQLRRNAVATIATYIKESDGISKLAFPAIYDADNDNEDVGPNKTPPASAGKKVKAAAIDYAEVLLARDLNEIAAFSPAVHVVGDTRKLIAMIGTVDADGVVHVLGAASDAAAIDAVAKSILADGMVGQSGALRQVAEAVGVLAYPREGKPIDNAKHEAWRRKVFYDRMPNNTKRRKQQVEPLTGTRRLAVDAGTGKLAYATPNLDKTVIHSITPVDTWQAVTVDAVLDHAQCEVIEDAVQMGTLSLMTGNVPEASKQGDAVAVVPVARIDDATFDLTFKTRDTAVDQRVQQIMPEDFEATWTAEIKHGDLDMLRNRFLGDWLAKLGRDKQLKRANNKNMGFKVSSETINVQFNKTGDNKHPSRTFGTVTKLDAGKPIKFTLRSKDIVPPLWHMGRIALKDTIKLQGNDTHVLMTFKSFVGDHVISIPVVESVDVVRKKPKK